MKLAEALVERKAAQTKVSELNQRLIRVAIVQEGEDPAEDPALLLQELEQVCQRLEALIVAINQANGHAVMADGRTIMVGIAQRDVLRMRLGVVDSLLKSTGNPQFRTRGSEIKFVTTVNVARLQRERDHLAREYRELDTLIQGANWQVDLELEEEPT
jgi:hypothetical protein